MGSDWGYTALVSGQYDLSVTDEQTKATRVAVTDEQAKAARVAAIDDQARAAQVEDVTPVVDVTQVADVERSLLFLEWREVDHEPLYSGP